MISGVIPAPSSVTRGQRGRRRLERSTAHVEGGRAGVDAVLHELAEEGVGVGELPHHVGDEAGRGARRPVSSRRER